MITHINVNKQQTVAVAASYLTATFNGSALNFFVITGAVSGTANQNMPTLLICDENTGVDVTVGANSNDNWTVGGYYVPV